VRSSTGQYFVGLDHVRAVAAFLVVAWHFAHGFTGYPVRFNQAPELGLIDEGHCGVALFMALSGYLFAKIIRDRPIHYLAFFANRALRLVPLLFVALALYGIQWHRDDLAAYAGRVAAMLLWRPDRLSNGVWSIVAEAHFYLVLPLLLWGVRRWPLSPLLLIAMAISLRGGLWLAGADIQSLAYLTIVGRIDQFALGIFFFYSPPKGRMAALLLAVLILFYAFFDAAGGLYSLDAPALWIVIPTIEGAGFAAAISWYDRNAFEGRWTWPIRKAGEYSYSIYLLHFFLVFDAANFIERRVMHIGSLYAAMPWALAFFAGMTVIGHFSYVWIERPFLRFRRPYVLNQQRGQSRASPTISPITPDG
jgi:peptidoglycan/LPS O-acetylase OafA/YrhL